MGLKRIKIDSIRELKYNKQLAKENEQLRNQVAELMSQIKHLRDDVESISSGSKSEG